MLSYRAVAAGLTLLFLSAAQDAAAQIKEAVTDSVSARESVVRRQRRAAGLRSGSWQVQGLSQVSGSTYATVPAFEGYFQRGLDRHLVIESSAGFWYRSERAGAGGRNNSYVIPMMTSLKLYPATGPGSRLEPFVSAGVGFTLGIDDRDGGGGLTGGTTGGTAMLMGLGAKGGVGVEYHFGSAFGVTLGGGYQYVRFFADVGGERTYRGVQVFGGLTYRFQY